MAKKGFGSVTGQFLSLEKPAAPIEGEAPEVTGYKPPEGYKLVPEVRSERLQLTLTPTLKKELTEEARKKGVSVNQFVNECIITRLHQKEGDNTDNERE